MSLPWANTKADVLAVRKTVRRRSYHQFIGEGDAVNYLARQRDNVCAVTGNPNVPIRFHRIRRGRVLRRRRQSPGGGVALLADPRRRPSRSSTPDHTEPPLSSPLREPKRFRSPSNSNSRGSRRSRCVEESLSRARSRWAYEMLGARTDLPKHRWRPRLNRTLG